MNDACLRIRSLLHDYLEGELAEPVSRRVSEHLRSCRDCERHAERWSDDLHELLESSSESVPENFVFQVRRALRWKQRRRVVTTQTVGRLLPLAAAVLLPFLAHRAFRALESFEASPRTGVELHASQDVVVRLHPPIDERPVSLAGPLTLWTGASPLDLRLHPSVTLTLRAGAVLHRARPVEAVWNESPGRELLVPFDTLWGSGVLRTYDPPPPRLVLPFEGELHLESRSRLELRATRGPAPAPLDATNPEHAPDEPYELVLRAGAGALRDARGTTHTLAIDAPVWWTEGGLTDERGRLRGRIVAARGDGAPWGPWSGLRVTTEAPGVRIETRTDANGDFTLYLPRGVAPFGDLEIQNDRTWLARRPLTDFTREPLEIALRNVPYHALLLEDASGRPLPGASVEVACASGALWRTTANERGIAQLPDIAPWPWTATIHHPSLARPHTARLGPRTTRITIDGTPHEGHPR